MPNSQSEKSYYLKQLFLVVIFLFAGLISTSLYGQKNKIKFNRISVEKGLSQSTVFELIQDSYGYIWIATYDGLNCYNASEIVIYKHRENKPNSLIDNYVQALFVDINKELWIGTNSKGICKYNYVTNDFTKIDLKNNCGTSIYSINQFDQNHLVILSEQGISILNTTNNSCKKMSNEEYYSLKKAPSLLSFFNKDSLNGIAYSCKITDRKGNIWHGTDNGLLRDKNGKEILYKNDLFDINSISANEITSILEDKGGVIWVGTSLGGICKWDRLNEGLELFRNNPSQKNSLSNSKVRCFYEDSKKRVWIGTVEGGLNLWNQEEDTFKSWSTKDGLNNSHIRDLVEWDGKYLIAMDGGGIQSFNPNANPVVFSNFLVDSLALDSRVWDLDVHDNTLWIATYGQGLFKIYEGKTTHFLNKIPSENTTWITSTNKGTWVGTFGEGLFLINDKGIKNWTKENSNLSDNRIYSIVPDEKGGIWLGTKGGVNKFNLVTEKFITYTTDDGLPNGTVMGIVHGRFSDIWLSTNKGISHFYPDLKKVFNYDINSGLQNNEFLVHSFLDLKEGNFLFGGINGFNVFPHEKLISNQYLPPVIITNFHVESGDWFSDSAIVTKNIIDLEYYQNEFTIEFSATSYADGTKNSYAYKMEGFDSDWKLNGHRRHAQYTNLPPGKYIFKVKAANNDGIWNDEAKTLIIIIHPAYWQTIWFKISVGLFIILLLFFIYKIRIRRIQLQNKKLETQVVERTKEVVSQKKVIEEKNELIEEAFKDIKDSIKYAKRIQTAILPSQAQVDKLLPDSFVLYKPKDIVAGDFYWIEEKDNKVLFSSADCTGHGVPGAMVSVICINSMNRAVREFNLAEPGKILDKVRELVSHEFQKGDSIIDKSGDEIKDGMDLALVSLEYSENASNQTPYCTLNYAGANNPLWIIRDNEIMETKADKQPVGNYFGAKPFTNHKIELKKGDLIYVFSDGYVDQFGGEKLPNHKPGGKKFKVKALREMLLKIHTLPLADQKEFIDKTFEDWKGSFEQIDDVCMIGVRI